MPNNRRNDQPLTLDFSDRTVAAAALAEQRLYDFYGIKAVDHYIKSEKTSLKIRVCEIGTGDPVLIVPGNTGDGFPFVPLIAQFKGKRILVLNRPGGGLSEGIDHNKFDFRELAAETITSVLDYFSIKSIPIISHSMGSHWSLWFALDKPERVEKLILLGIPGNVLECKPPFVLRLAAVRGLNKALFRKIMPKNVGTALRGLSVLGHSEDTLKVLPQEMKECYYYFQQLPHYEKSSLSLMETTNTLFGSKKEIQIKEEDLKGIFQKTLLVWGTNDPFGKVEIGENIAALLPNAKFERINGGGHLPWLDDPIKCGRLAQAFLDVND
ncbi:MAG: alpha/beta hydrolase [Clostridiales bacterium]|jgi:pimeloyl-ACP methyl ester carboxylesterase|nr:alpha/beta hydrolase [Clostridiales bacterium]